MNSTNFQKRLNDLPSSIWNTIAQIDEVKGRWSHGASLHPYQLENLKKSVLVTSTGSSTRIEGATLTDFEVEKLIRQSKTKKLKNRDEEEVRGYFELLDNIFKSYEKIPFTESSILSLHSQLLKYTTKDVSHRGKYKSVENIITAIGPEGQESIILKTTPPYLVQKQMEQIIAWTSEALQDNQYHSLAIIGNFIMEFLAIHPFQDGNGRLSRILTNLLLLKSGYEYVPYVSHEKLIENNKQDYYLALRASQSSFRKKKETITPWITFFVYVLKKQAQQAKHLLTEESLETILSAKQLAVWQAIEKRETISAGEISKRTGIARPTVNQGLDKLLSMKKNERIGIGRATRYRVRK